MTSNALDRRLTARVHNVWKKIAGKGFPRRSQVDSRDLAADWSNCLMIDLDPASPRSRLSYVGSALRDPTWPTFDRQCVSECLDGTLLELVTRHIPRLIAKGKPISFGGSAIHDDNDILYRTILLPLSETGDQIDGILGAVAFREVSASEDVAVPEERQTRGTRAQASSAHAAARSSRAHRQTRTSGPDAH